MSDEKYRHMNDEIPMTDERLKADKVGNDAVKVQLPRMIVERPQQAETGDAVKKTADELAIITERNKSRSG